ncbi:CinA family protein [Lagierella sp. ICN-221743]
MKYTVLKEVKEFKSSLNLEESFVPFLIDNKITVSTGESLTAGLIAASIANIAGASNVLELGAVTYTEEVKMKLLNVSRETLKKHTAVSFETANEMLRGLSEISNSNLNIVATGYAGPGENSGLVYLGIGYKDSENLYRLSIKGSRNEVRRKVVNLSFYLSKKIIEDYEGSKLNVGKVFLA